MTINHILLAALIPRLDAEVILCHILNTNRSWLISHSEDIVSSETVNRYKVMEHRRLLHEPVSYITGEKEFYGRSFIVDRRVLIPRPSTETLIDEVKLLFGSRLKVDTPRITPADTGIVIFTWIKKQLSTFNFQLSILDAGTGSGCIAITLALEIPNLQIIATDISADALEVAKINANQHGVTDRITFTECDLIPPNLSSSKPLNLQTPISPFLVVSNPPYIPAESPLPKDIEDFEPHEALFAGEDGMSTLRPLSKICLSHPQCVGFSLECRSDQVDELTAAIEAKNDTHY